MNVSGQSCIAHAAFDSPTAAYIMRTAGLLVYIRVLMYWRSGILALYSDLPGYDTPIFCFDSMFRPHIGQMVCMMYSHLMM